MIITLDYMRVCFFPQTDFRDFPAELRQAISLARRMQDPLLEFCQLCTADQDLACLKLHPTQVSEPAMRVLALKSFLVAVKHQHYQESCSNMSL